MSLSGNQRRHLRALAHPLKPVVQVGHSGITPGLVREMSETLERHELIKIKFAREAPASASEAAQDAAQAVGAEVAQVIGQTLILYRRRQKDPKIELPRPRRPAPEA